MKVYTAKKDADEVEHIWFWGLNVTWRATEVGIWLGAAKCGLGYVDLVPTEGDYIINTETRRYYGPILIKFKRSER